MEFLTFEGMQYLIDRPAHLAAGERHPVVLLLHGAGTRGEDIGLLAQNPYFRITARHEALPCITVAPLCATNTWFDRFETLIHFARAVAQADYADPDRVYLMGASMGGYATWQLAMSAPELFAAIVPICGGGMAWNTGRLRHVPVWAFHGEDDGTVFAEESRRLVEAVNRRGGSARLTLYPATGHDAWSATYGNREVFDWLLAQRRYHAPCEQDGSFADSKAFG